MTGSEHVGLPEGPYAETRRTGATVLDYCRQMYNKDVYLGATEPTLL